MHTPSPDRAPTFLERHQLTWGSDEGECVCERIGDARFKTTLWAVEVAADGLTTVTRWSAVDATPHLDGVAAVEARRTDGADGTISLDLVLAEPLPRVHLPWAGAPAPPGEVSFDEALERAATMGYPIALDAIREAPAYFVFPWYQIGSRGGIVEKRGGRLVELGSAFPIDDWLWGYESGLLEEPPGDLVVVEVREAHRALDALGGILRARPTSRLLQALPLLLPEAAHWMAIPHLRRAEGSMRWEIRRGGRAGT
jgi:hypothetical protein